ncbi:hypothetical protein MP638_005096 [Amoeboaphelidium occidentale]|nr:hypothetical protein MP638_005096 [Amoeboaphelidium occidentale]
MDKFLPKIYLLTTQEYPKYEYPHKGSGVWNEYPSYKFLNKRVPTGHMAFLCLSGVFGSVYLLTKLSSSGSKKTTKGNTNTKGSIEFPQPKRNWDEEKKEFIENYVNASHH